MTAPLDLKQLEKKAYRTIYEDGLLDMNMAGIVASMALLAFPSEEDAGRWLRFGLCFGGMIASALIYQLGKKFITGPRLGQVTFGPARKRRGATLAAILGVIVGIQALIVLGSALVWNNPALVQRLGWAAAQPESGKLLVAVIGALFVGPSMTLVAYFTDFPRGYAIAVLLSLGVFLFIWFRSSLMMWIAAAMIFLPGVILFVRFLRKYPLPPVEARHDG